MSDFHLLLQEQIPSLIRYATALTRDRDEAIALVEDTVIEVMKENGKWRAGADLRLRLLSVLHEHRDNPFRRPDPAALISQAPADPAALLTLSELDWALNQLPEEQRGAILLIGLEGLTYRHAAAVLRAPIGAVRLRLTRGRDNLCRLMGVESAPERARAAAGRQRWPSTPIIATPLTDSDGAQLASSSVSQ